MRSKAILGLVLLNVILLGSLVFHNGWVSRAGAQVARVPAPSEYLMVTGEVQGGSAGLVFIIDTRNNLLTARSYTNGTTMDDMPPIDLARVFK